MADRTRRKLILPAEVVIGFSVLFVMWFLLPYTPLRGSAGFSQLAAIDPVVVGALMLIAIGGVAVLVIQRKRQGPKLVLASIVVLALVFGSVFFGRVASQGVNSGAPPLEDSSLRILSWNAGGVGVDRIASRLDSLLSETRADVVVLPETGWKTAESVNGDLDSRGRHFTVFDWEGTATSILMDPTMAAVDGYQMQTDRMPPWAGLEIVPTRPSASSPIIVAAHFQQASIGSTDTWRAHLKWAADVCDSSPYVIIVGDTNSTLNQLGEPSIGSCQDVAAATGSGAAATWPSWLPAQLGVSIDRFLVGSAWDAASQTFEVRRDVSEEGQDHWPILVSLR